MLTKKKLRSIRDASCGRVPCDMLIRNAKILDVFSGAFFDGDIAVHDGVIVALSKREADEVVDAGGRWVTPALIDAHHHVESTLVTPDTLNDVLLPRGIGTVVSDPHEIANVAGEKGVAYMTAAAEALDLRLRIMLPSCVPSTHLEHAGARLDAADLKHWYSNERVLGLAEVMNAPAVAQDEDMLQKLHDARKAHRVIDGHGATLDETMNDLYAAMGIRTDHECVSPDEVLDRVRRGMYVFLREGTAAKNLEDLLPAVTPVTMRRLCFCTDDKHVNDLLEDGGVDDVVRRAIRWGLPEETAYTMATLNPAECYQMARQGAVAPGYAADLVIWEDIRDVRAAQVYIGGRCVAEKGAVALPKHGTVPVPNELKNSVHIKKISRDDLALPLVGKTKMHAIGVRPGSIVTSDVVVKTGGSRSFMPDTARDLAKLAVIERHQAIGQMAVCPVAGFGLMEGAIASTVAHDSHNMIILGMKDEDMLCAMAALEQMQGGYVVIKDGQVMASVSLEVAGLMTQKEPSALLKDLHRLHEAAEKILREKAFNPFQMLSFISLPVIPQLKLTDMGLVDVARFQVIDVAF
jgi:adenine deaminase